MKYKYTDKEITELLKTLVIIHDTREQEHQHIIDYFESKKITHKSEKLEYGDYTCLLPANQELGIGRDMYFSNVLSIERKGSLDELAGNFTKERTRIESEFLRSKGKIMLLIEGATYGDIIQHNYRSKYEPKSFVATLKAFEARYGLHTTFIEKKYAGNMIYQSLRYHVREFLNN